MTPRRVRHSRMAQGEDARGDLLRAGRVLAQAEGMQLLVDEERLGLARVVAVHGCELAPTNVHDPTAPASHGKDVRVLAMAHPRSVGEDDQAEIAGRRLP